MEPACFTSPLVWIGTGFYLCFLINEILVPEISRRFFAVYAELKRPILLEWNGRFLSTIHAIFICACSAWCLAFHENLRQDKLFGTDSLSQASLGISCGYMIYDFLTMCFYTRGMALLTFVMHHVVAAVSLCFILVNKYGVFFVHYKMLTELSTPFLNVRWFLRYMGYPANHPKSAWSTVAFTVSFVTVRLVAAVPFWIWIIHCTNEFESPRSHIWYLTKIFVYFVAIMLDILNLTWTVMVVPRFKLAVKSLREHYQKKV